MPRPPIWPSLVLALAACAPQKPVVPDIVPAPPQSVAFFDQGWTAADRETFDTTPQGSHLMPLAWFSALRRTDRDALFVGDKLARYGYLAAAGPLPVGFVADGRPGDVPQIGMTCAACHTGQLKINGAAFRIDGGRSPADFQSFLTDLGIAARATVAEPGRFTAFAEGVLGPAASAAQTERLRQDFGAWTTKYTAFMRQSLPDPAWGPGRLDAFGMIFNRVVGLDLGGSYHTADAPVRYPFIWDAPRQDHTQWIGVAENGTYLRALARNTGEVFGVFGVLTPVPQAFHTARYDNTVNFSGLQTLEEKLVRLQPPRWPASTYPLDPVLVAQGKEIFADACASCHATGPSQTTKAAWNTPLSDTGTDRRTFDNAHLTGDPGILLGTRQPILTGERLTAGSPKASILANAVIGALIQAALTQDPAIRRAIEQDFAEGRLPLLGPASRSTTSEGVLANITNATRNLYKAAPSQPAAAYEARRLTGIWAVAPYLHNGAVASLHELLTPPEQRLQRFAVGHQEFDPVNVGLQTAPGPSRAMFVVDPSNGNGNGGHTYGTTLPESGKRALIEYLKTL